MKTLGKAVMRLGILAIAAGLAPALAQEDGEAVPRFMSLSASEANLRTGPGLGYPILWVLQRPGLPVEVLRRFQGWAQIREPGGATGWVDGKFLSATRTVMVSDAVRTLFAAPSATAPARWRAEPGVIARARACKDAWCQLDIDGKTGWVLRIHVWGTYPGENFAD
ncbi:MAG: SH3 domain-containing protein [Pseudomonadota bacterium]|jgi:SH3-like domain-containing protein